MKNLAEKKPSLITIIASCFFGAVLITLYFIGYKELVAYTINALAYVTVFILILILIAGGLVTDFSGNHIPNYLDFPKHRIPSLLVSSSRDVHQKILEQMRGYPTATA